MAKMTITEALQEIKTIGKRLEKKRLAVGDKLARDTRIKDPLEKDGGSEKFVREERQAIGDLEKRIVAIRTAIQRSNLSTVVPLDGNQGTVAEWLTWRREVSAGQVTFLNSISSNIRNIRSQVQQKGGRVIANVAQVNEGTSYNDPPQLIVNVDEKAVLDEQEKLETLLGDLDGKLSLLNATTVVDV